MNSLSTDGLVETVAALRTVQARSLRTPASEHRSKVPPVVTRKPREQRTAKAVGVPGDAVAADRLGSWDPQQEKRFMRAFANKCPLNR
jgi:hypothetical protein